ncbi:hypothetical protein [Methylobacterium nodulans]|uniref:Type II secretion system protein GspC N-terminal domain-containing protein n=1 Tax=Methylobacterium nodulans (strain LMG 21967 / CNCM I-2342 / ORS 2060) TaxID=460265 RepID=B8IR78_METNO|nr:hypothetical protein [Methylobacterium nodulans]ACL56780.1 conserved hypothetical protein [Methylobacterium nodulans ORS 2060]
MRSSAALPGLALLLAGTAAAAAQAGSIGAMLFPGSITPSPAAPPPAAPVAPPAAGPAPPVLAPSGDSPTAAARALPASGPAPAEEGRPARTRPLFSATRRPPALRVAAPMPVQPAVPPPPPPPPKPAPQLHLVGVVEGLDRPLALLRRAPGDRALTVRVGDRVEDWEVASIEAGRVLLRDGSREQDYRLFAREGAAKGPAAATLGAAPAGLPMITGSGRILR